jgi:phage tail-like protein
VRGLQPGLGTPFPLGATLPGLYEEDDLVQRLCAALDEVLAPVVSTLDCLPAYLDPGTAPDDLVDWLAGWVGVALDDVPPDLRRHLVARAAVVHRRRGTLRGVREALTAWFGLTAEVTESGGTSWSAEPGASLPGSAEPFLLVRIQRSDLGSVDVRRVESLVAAVTPAHVPNRVEVVP